MHNNKNVLYVKEITRLLCYPKVGKSWGYIKLLNVLLKINSRYFQVTVTCGVTEWCYGRWPRSLCSRIRYMNRHVVVIHERLPYSWDYILLIVLRSRVCPTSRWCGTWWRAEWWSGPSTAPTACTSSWGRAGLTGRRLAPPSCASWRTSRPQRSPTSDTDHSSTPPRGRRCTRCRGPP